MISFPSFSLVIAAFPIQAGEFEAWILVPTISNNVVLLKVFSKYLFVPHTKGPGYKSRPKQGACFDMDARLMW